MPAGILVPLASSTLDLPPGSYIYSIDKRSGACAVISSDDSLRRFDGATLRLQAGGLVERTHAGVTCLRAFDEEGNVWVTAGRDGFVRCWDMRAGRKATEVRSGMIDPNYCQLAREHATQTVVRSRVTPSITRLLHPATNACHWIRTPHVTSKCGALVRPRCPV